MRKVINIFCYQKTATSITTDEDGDDEEQAPLIQQQEEDNDHLFADRLLNPEEYEKSDDADGLPELAVGNENPLARMT